MFFKTLDVAGFKSIVDAFVCASSSLLNINADVAANMMCWLFGIFITSH